MKAKDKMKLILIKNNAIKLRSRYQLPYELVHAINGIKDSTNIDIVKYLLAQTEHCLRTPNYYKKYKYIEEQINHQIRCDLLKMNYIY